MLQNSITYTMIVCTLVTHTFLGKKLVLLTFCRFVKVYIEGKEHPQSCKYTYLFLEREIYFYF